MTQPDQLYIRPARPDDYDAVVAMVATVWGGNDYIPYVWDEWLADPDGPLLVGELAGLPVALAKLTALSPGEDWFHGARVAPEQRGQGHGRAMLRRCVELSHKRGAHALRYLTSEDNPTMHRMGEILGFQLLYAPVWYRAPAITGPLPQIAPLPPERLPALLHDLERSPLLAATGGLYSHDWCNFELTEGRLSEHLARGEVFGWRGGSATNGREHAWAIVVPREEGGIWLAHVEGQGAELERLCAALLTQPDGPPEEAYGRALLPPTAACMPALLAAGFAPTDEHMRVYELRFLEIRD